MMAPPENAPPTVDEFTIFGPGSKAIGRCFHFMQSLDTACPQNIFPQARLIGLY